MKVIDLLNKIANGEEVPKKIKYDNAIAEYDEEEKDYYAEGYSGLFAYTIPKYMNDEVEIIEEEKKIEKLKYDCIDQDGLGWYKLQTLSDKIDEIIDKINEE